jgi:glycosyltransferase involved in cell wall biosynthesis
MACGVPVVASPRVCGGLQARPGRDLLVGEDAEQFAQHVLDVINDPVVRQTIGHAGRQYVERYHNWIDIVRDLVGVYEQACCPEPHRDAAPLTASTPR